MGTLLKCNIDIETERQKRERQKDNETQDDEYVRLPLWGVAELSLIKC